MTLKDPIEKGCGEARDNTARKRYQERTHHCCIVNYSCKQRHQNYRFNLHRKEFQCPVATLFSLSLPANFFTRRWNSSKTDKAVTIDVESA